MSRLQGVDTFRAPGIPATVAAAVVAAVAVPLAIVSVPPVAVAAGAPAVAALLAAFWSCRRGGRWSLAAVVVSSTGISLWAVACVVRGVLAFWEAAGHG